MEGLIKLLKKAHLKGILTECVVVFEDGIGKVDSIDQSNIMFISVQEEVDDVDDGPVGIANLPMVCKYLEDKSEGLKISWTEDKLVLKGKGSSVKAQLVSPEEVATALDGTKFKKKLKQLVSTSINPSTSKLEELLYHIDLIKAPSIVFSVGKGKLTVHTNESQDDQFRCTIGTVGNKEEELEVEIYTDHFTALVKFLLAEELEPEFIFGPEAPLVVQIDKNNLWALTPIQA